MSKSPFLLVLWKYWKQVVLLDRVSLSLSLSLTFIIETMMGLWRYSLPIEERGWYEGLRKGLTALVWLLNIFDDARATYDYLISFHYIYSLYCLYLKFYCVCTAAIGNAIPAVVVERGKKNWCQLISVGKSPTEELTWGCVWVEACIEFENPHHTLSKARVSVSITSSFFISFIVFRVTLYWPVLQ